MAQNAPDLFGTLHVSGVFAHIAIQVVLNIAVVTNFIPNTGVSLPFISYGGTSETILLAEIGHKEPAQSESLYRLHNFQDLSRQAVC